MMPTPVERGTTLQVGHWYQITEIDPEDFAPSLAVGAVLQCCADAGPGELSPEWQDFDSWFADYQGTDEGYGTLVTGLVEVEAPK